MRHAGFIGSSIILWALFYLVTRNQCARTTVLSRRYRCYLPAATMGLAATLIIADGFASNGFEVYSIEAAAETTAKWLGGTIAIAAVLRGVCPRL
jgi:hypothetical protein